jgi:hypothetical protein
VVADSCDAVWNGSGVSSEAGMRLRGIGYGIDIGDLSLELLERWSFVLLFLSGVSGTKWVHEGMGICTSVDFVRRKESCTCSRDAIECRK